MTTIHVRPPVLLVVTVVALLATCAAGIDATTRRIPDRIVLAAAIAVLLGALNMGETAPLMGASASATPVLLVHLLDPKSIGFGDVKLAAVLGGAVGLIDWRMALLVPALAATIAALQAGVLRTRCVSLAPALVIGYGVAVVVPALGNGA